MAIESLDVLEHLKALSPNHVYFLAPKASVLRGYEYYVQGRLESYSWNRARTILAASVKGSIYYAVTFSVEQGQLVYSCRCQAWTASTQCKHVICALLTTVNLLVPDTFRVATTQRIGQEKLSEQLSEQLLQDSSGSEFATKPAPVHPQFEVNLVDLHGQTAIVLTNHGKVCQTFLGMPTELAILLRATQDPAWSVHDALRDFLTHHGQAFPIYFENREGRTLVEWAPSMTYALKTEFDLREEMVTVAARCFRFGVAQEHAQLFMGMVVDLGAYKLAPLDDDLGWAFYDVLAENFNDTDEMDMMSGRRPIETGSGKFGTQQSRSQGRGRSVGNRPMLFIPVEEFAGRSEEHTSELQSH